MHMAVIGRMTVRYIIVLIYGLLSLSIIVPGYIHAQKIVTDRIEDDGSRQLICSGKSEKLGDSKYEFTIKCIENTGYKKWLLLVSSANYIPGNALLVFKLGNSDIIDIPVSDIAVRNVDRTNVTTHHSSTAPLINSSVAPVTASATFNNGASVSTYGTTISSVTTINRVPYYIAIFRLSELQYDDIKRYGIVKVRISSRNSFNEKIWKKDRLGKYITKSRANISRRLNDVGFRSIYEDL